MRCTRNRSGAAPCVRIEPLTRAARVRPPRGLHPPRPAKGPGAARRCCALRAPVLAAAGRRVAHRRLALHQQIARQQIVVAEHHRRAEAVAHGPRLRHVSRQLVQADLRRRGSQDLRNRISPGRISRAPRRRAWSNAACLAGAPSKLSPLASASQPSTRGHSAARRAPAMATEWKENSRRATRGKMSARRMSAGARGSPGMRASMRPFAKVPSTRAPKPWALSWIRACGGRGPPGGGDQGYPFRGAGQGVERRGVGRGGEVGEGHGEGRGQAPRFLGRGR